VILYQLRARGSMANFDGMHAFFSRRVFSSKESAEMFAPEFRVLVTAGDHIDDLVDDDDLKITVVELEFV
jgi:hypothetical protein